MSDVASLTALVQDLSSQVNELQGQLAEGGDIHRKLITTTDIDAFWLMFGGVLVFWMQARGRAEPASRRRRRLVFFVTILGRAVPRRAGPRALRRRPSPIGHISKTPPFRRFLLFRSPHKSSQRRASR